MRWRLINCRFIIIIIISIGTKVDDLGWPWSAISSNFLWISRDFAHLRGNNGKTNEDRPVLSTMHRLRWYIAGRSSARGSTIAIQWAKMAIFLLHASISRKRYEIRPMLLLMTNRNLHMRFRLAARLMTLDDLELLYVWIFSEFRVISQIWEATTAKRMTLDLYCQRCIDYVDILLGVPPQGGLQSQYRGWKWQTVSNAATVTVNQYHQLQICCRFLR